MSYEEAVSALRRQLSNISDSIVEKDKLIVQLNEAYRHEEKVAIYVCMLYMHPRPKYCGGVARNYFAKYWGKCIQYAWLYDSW